MAGLILNVIDAIMSGPEGGEYATMSIAGIDPIDPNVLYNRNGAVLTERSFQYWPESISDSIDIGWSFRDLPGASHALAQWGSNNGRTITFEAQLSRSMKPRRNLTFREKLQASGTYPDDAISRPYNVNIVDQIRYLRAYCYPTYASLEGVVSAIPPAIAILNIPNMGLNESGGDAIFAIMTACDATHTLAFPDGTPRRATVALTFRQVVQNVDGVKFKGFGDGAPSPYQMPAVIQNGDSFDKNAGRGTNGIRPGDIK